MLVNLSLYISNVFIDKINIPLTEGRISIDYLKEKLLQKNKDIISGMHTVRLVFENVPDDIDASFKTTLDHYDLFINNRFTKNEGNKNA